MAMRATANRYRRIVSSFHNILHQSQTRYSSIGFSTAIHSCQRIYRHEHAYRVGILFVCGVTMSTLYTVSNTQLNIIADAGKEQVFVAIRAYQSTLQQYAKGEKYDEMIDYLRREIMRLSSSSGKYNDELVDFLENKLCATLCVLGRCDEAMVIIDRYSERELIEKQCILRAAFVYHAAERFEHAIHLFELMKKNIDQQLENKFNKKRLERIKKEVAFTVEMHLAECYTQLKELEKAKEVYSELKIDDIISFGADSAILEWFEGHGTTEESEGFKNFLLMHRAQNSNVKPQYEE